MLQHSRDLCPQRSLWTRNKTHQRVSANRCVVTGTPSLRSTSNRSRLSRKRSPVLQHPEIPIITQRSSAQQRDRRKWLTPLFRSDRKYLLSALMTADLLCKLAWCPYYSCTSQGVNISAVTQISAKYFIQSPIVIREHAAAKSLLPLTLWGNSKGKQGFAHIRLFTEN